jgi:hypothetical protein
MNATLWTAALLTAALAAGPAAAQTNRGGTMSQDQPATEERQSDTDANMNTDRSSGGVNRSQEQRPSDRSAKTQESEAQEYQKGRAHEYKSGRAKKKHHTLQRPVKEQKPEKTIDEGGSVR